MISAQTKKDTKKESYKQRTARFDTLIVFGEGPVKPVFIPQEATPDLSEKWSQFKNDKTSREPNFTILEDTHYLSKLLQINTDPLLTREQKERERGYLRHQWQWTGHFALKRFGRQNALAAGMALYKGMTKNIILSGGKTQPHWVRKHFSEEQLSRFPTEAELMKDIIKRNFDKLYFERYQQPIERAILIEDASTNTLENFAYSINKYPDILSSVSKTGFLSSRHHLKRISMLAELFCVPFDTDAIMSPQEVLKRAKKDATEHTAQLAKRLSELDCSCEQNLHEEKEEQLIRGLQDPAYVTYWVGYVAEVKYPRIIQEAIRKITDPSWMRAVQETMLYLGINLHDFVGVDLAYLYKNEPEKYMSLVNSLRKCKSAEFRKTPPPLA